MVLVLAVIVSSILLSVGAQAPEAKLSIGTFRGSSINGTDQWLGIPYAEPPVGSLRFKAPVPIARAFPGVQNAFTFGNACPQPISASLGAPIGEDCLFLNVWRPENTPEDAQLPVLIWIHGGVYNTGSSSNPEFNGTGIINRSKQIGKPIVFVSINYRLNTFGFLASSHVPVSDLNAGLQDQRQAFTFVQENIARFGGDPTKVTIWGQSAGAGSVEAQIIYHSSKPLFRGAIMDSLTGPFKNSPPPSTYDEPGKPFALVLNATGCTAGPTSFRCLQEAPFEPLVNFSNTMIHGTLNSQFWEPTVAPGSFSPVLASTKVAAGDFLHIPMIAGTNLNEGNSFSTSLLGQGLTGEAQDDAFDTFVLKSVIDETKVTSDVLDKIKTLYPANDSSQGAPFNTGDSLFDRAAAWYGDNMFLAARRRFFEKAAPLQPIFAYHFREFILGNNITLGVAHASELPLLFGPVPLAAAIETGFAQTWLDFYLNFIHDLSPGPAWPQYKLGSKLVLQLKRDNITPIVDDFHQDMTDFLNSPEVLSEWEK
ncbi:alpha/beta-hydrolase [Dentipellis sp. KUC8613]|nr:alpha/beta-hydrolase [Dentipellis sp. KUC8613]